MAEDYRRSKHVYLKYHHVREHVATELVKLVKVGTNEMVADFLTKPLRRVGIVKALKALNVSDFNEDAYDGGYGEEEKGGQVHTA